MRTEDSFTPSTRSSRSSVLSPQSSIISLFSLCLKPTNPRQPLASLQLLVPACALKMTPSVAFQFSKEKPLNNNRVQKRQFLDAQVSLAPTFVTPLVILLNCWSQDRAMLRISCHCWSRKGKTTIYFLRVYCWKVYFPKVYFPNFVFINM